MCICMCACQREFIWISLQSLPITQVINQQGWWSPHPSMLLWVQMPTHTPNRLARLRYRKEMKQSVILSIKVALKAEKSTLISSGGQRLLNLPAEDNRLLIHYCCLRLSCKQSIAPLLSQPFFSRKNEKINLFQARQQDSAKLPRLLLSAQICFTGTYTNAFLCEVFVIYEHCSFYLRKQIWTVHLLH